MNLVRPFRAFVALLLTAGAVTAEPNATVALSYRDAYRAMVVFEKYGKPKNLIQHHLQVMPREKSVNLDGVQLTLEGKGTQLNLPLDPAGRAVFPLLKAAYDENAALVLNRPAGQFQLRARASIAVRPDGVYDLSDLRAACEQVLAYQRYANTVPGARQCVGVRMAFARKGGEPNVRLRKTEGTAAALPASDGSAFSDDPNDSFRVVDVRFDGARGQVLSATVPVAIAAAFEPGG